MKKEGKNNMKKLFSIAVAISMLTTAGLIAMLSTGPIVMNVSAGVEPPAQNVTAPRLAFEMNASDDEDMYVDDNGELRVFGEEGAIYPTQSYRGVDDFIYPNYVDPFDPGVIAKDSVTFNPAFIDMTYYEPYLMNYTNQTMKWSHELHQPDHEMAGLGKPDHPCERR